TGVSVLHRNKYHGAGIRVGLIDRGMYYGHSAFADPVNPLNRRLIGHDFVGDDYTGRNTPRESDDFVERCGSGIGTKMADIIAHNTKFPKGIAPHATLGIYKVFGCHGVTSTTVVLQALTM
ncbi:peptidase S8/S53 domain-containing protein, partial [Syncephalis pseudoplumigaleata]